MGVACGPSRAEEDDGPQEQARQVPSYVSLSEVLRLVREGHVNGDDIMRLASLYLSMKSKRASAKEILSALFSHAHGGEILRVISAVVVGAKSLQSEGFVNSQGGNTLLISHAQSKTNHVNQRAKQITQKVVFDQQRLSKRIASKLRSRHPGMHVDPASFELFGEAIRQRIRHISKDLMRIATIRHMSSIIAKNSKAERVTPRGKIRDINLTLMQSTSARREQERQKLLQLGDQSNKRKRQSSDDEFDEELRTRAEKARAEEEERRLADAANEATRSALGDAKYLKWFAHGKNVQKTTELNPRVSSAVTSKQTTRAEATEKASKTGLETHDSKISFVDVICVLKSEKAFNGILPRLFHTKNLLLFNVGNSN